LASNIFSLIIVKHVFGYLTLHISAPLFQVETKILNWAGAFSSAVVLMGKLKGNAKLLENVRLVTDNGRGHSVTCDLSEAAGGTNAGPTPLELALMSLAGCGVIIYAEVCKNSKIDPGNIDIAVEAEKTPGSPVISDVTMKVNITSKARRGLVEAAWRRTEANCPVMIVYKESVPVRVEAQINAQ
jgi:uncharacterized OsmC-like protein